MNANLNLSDPALLRQQAYVNGEWLAHTESFAVHNPATGELLAQVAQTSLAQLDVALVAAEQAQRSWAQLTAKQRAQIMRRWFDLIVAHADDLALILTAEQGKPLPEARGEVLYGASFIEWFAEEAKRINGDLPATTWADKRPMVLKQPIGVCAAITPWNFPNAMITRKVAPAIAAGCSIVLKPAEQTPLSALALAVLAERAGLPAGVLNVVTADSPRSIEIGQALCASKVVRHLSFTGSTPVGRILMRQSADTVKKLALELGGHAPFIVFEDADLDAAVEGALQSKYRNAGQTCVCTNRFYVHENIYDEFLNRFAARIKALKVGNGMQAGIEQGPLIEEAALEKVQAHIADALSKGARLLAGGQRLHKDTLFFEPSLIADVRPEMLVMQEETFGPLAAVCAFKSEAEVIAAANATDFGLAAYFYARDIQRVWRIAEQLDYGIVGVNTGVVSNEVNPFGGVKQSGLGREGSRYGIDEYLEMKYVCLGGM